MAYVDKPRGFGENKVRIGTSIEVQNDVYSLCFNSMLTTRHIMMFMDPESGEMATPEDQKNLIAYYFKGEPKKLKKAFKEFDESINMGINN